MDNNSQGVVIDQVDNNNIILELEEDMRLDDDFNQEWQECI